MTLEISFSNTLNVILIIKKQVLGMKCELLYEGSKIKRENQRMMELEYVEHLKQMSSSKKINPHSRDILVNKIYDQFIPFDDSSVLNIETSIPLLHATKILQVIENIESAKQKIQNGQAENGRLKDQARFVYCLWKMIDEEEIETREIKEIIILLNQKFPAELTKCLNEIYRDQEAVFEFVEAWRNLLHDNQYYRSIEHKERKKQAKKEHYDGKLFGEDFFKKENTQIQEYFRAAKIATKKNSKNLSHQHSHTQSQNQQKCLKEKPLTSNIVNRLYQADKYKMREVQKKIEQQKRQRQMLQECTFKPEITQDRMIRSISAQKRGSNINGYQKTVQRMKIAQEMFKIEKEKRQHKPAGENYEKIREKKPNPPSFLQRKKAEEKVQFVIEFDLGRHKIKTKVHETDLQEDIAKNLCKIYCLKQQYFDKICSIIKDERQAYQNSHQL